MLNTKLRRIAQQYRDNYPQSQTLVTSKEDMMSEKQAYCVVGRCQALSNVARDPE